MKNLIALFFITSLTAHTFVPEAYLKRYNALSSKEKKIIQTILFEGCSFGKIKKENKKSVPLIQKAFELWQEATNYTHTKMLYKAHKKTVEEKEDAKIKYSEKFEELQKNMVPQSKHFYESSNIIKTIRTIPYLSLKINDVPQELSLSQKITHFFKEITCKIKKVFEPQKFVEFNLESMAEKEILLDLIHDIIDEGEFWLKQKPNDSYLNNPFCIIKDYINQ